MYMYIHFLYNFFEILLHTAIFDIKYLYLILIIFKKI